MTGSLTDVMVELGVRGGIGELRCGASLGDIAAALGPPTDLGRVRKRSRWPHRFCYGSVEFVVCQCRLVTSVHVSSSEFDTPDFPGRELVSLARPTSEAMAEAFRAANCPWQADPRQPQGETALNTDPTEGIRAEFVFTPADPNGDEHLLAAAGAWLRYSHVCPPIPAESVDDGFGLG